MLLEEAADVRNKHFRPYSRKFKMEYNRDVINRLLLTSDPILRSNRQQRKESKPFCPETISVLAEAQNMQFESSDDKENDEDSDSDLIMDLFILLLFYK